MIIIIFIKIFIIYVYYNDLLIFKKNSFYALLDVVNELGILS